MLAKRTRDYSSPESEEDGGYCSPPVGKQRKIASSKKSTLSLDDIDSVVFSDHILKYLENLEVIRFSLASIKCREIFRSYQAYTREFLFVMERFTHDETRVIFRECKTVICVNCGLDFSNILNYESNIVNMSIYGEIDRIHEDLITFMTRCKFNNLKNLVLQGLRLRYEDLAHITTSDHIEILKKNLRCFNVMNNPIISSGSLFKSFHQDCKFFFGRTNFFTNIELEKNKYYYCYHRIHDDTPFNIGAFFYSNTDFKDYKKAFEFFEIACKREPRAYEFIGYMYDKGRYVSKDYKIALENYLKGAEEVANCAMNAGMAYENGHGTEIDLRHAYKYYRMAADKGHVKAMEKMALGYQEGIPHVLPQDYQLAIKYYKRLEPYKSDDSAFQIGHIYEVGLKNYDLALFWFEKNLQNFTFAYRFTRIAKIRGKSIEFRRGITIFESEFNAIRETKVKKEDETDQINFTVTMLDILYFIGMLDSENQLLQLLFDNVSESTTNMLVKLGDFYRTDEHGNVRDAQRFYEAGISRGDKNAILGLAIMKITGVKGQFIDLEAAGKLLSLFMEQNEESYIFRLGVEFFYEKHYQQAMECFTKTGNTYKDAQYYISYIEGYYYEKGRNGYEQNIFRAMDNYKLSCTGNFLIPFAFYKTGKLAWKEKYDDLAFTVLKPLVAECQSHSNSPVFIYILACLYNGGYYLDENQMEAIKLFEKATNMGYQKAAKAYKRVLENLNNSASHFF